MVTAFASRQRNVMMEPTTALRAATARPSARSNLAHSTRNVRVDSAVKVVSACRRAVTRAPWAAAWANAARLTGLAVPLKANALQPVIQCLTARPGSLVTRNNAAVAPKTAPLSMIFAMLACVQRAAFASRTTNRAPRRSAASATPSAWAAFRLTRAAKRQNA